MQRERLLTRGPSYQQGTYASKLQRDSNAIEMKKMGTKQEEEEDDASDMPLNNKQRVQLYDQRVSAIQYTISVYGLYVVMLLIIIASLVVWGLTTFGYYVVEQTQVVIAAVAFILPLFIFALLHLIKYMKFLGVANAIGYAVIAIFLALYGLDNILNTIIAAAEIASTVTKYDTTVYLTTAVFEIILLAFTVATIYMLITIVYKLNEEEKEQAKLTLSK